VAVILRASSLPGDTEGLTRESSANNVNWPDILAPQFGHILMARHVRPVLREHLPAEPIDLAERHRAEAAGALEPETEAADAGKQIEDGEGHLTSS
jgi:hypothetical protein